ncbi:MAG TPA: bifunctional oligoribonuclease/PAP phosphatase NrnA [Longimicrobiales bacterium]
MTGSGILPIRRAAARRVLEQIDGAGSIVLTTHVNADGDGAGSEAAIAQWLLDRGRRVTIVNPTPFPPMFEFLIPDPSIIAPAGSAAAERALADADLIIVLDTAEPGRIGRVAKALAGRAVVVIDHHVHSESMIEGLTLQDVSACATGELVFDLLEAAELPVPWPQQVLEGLYAAIVTDTGSFRFSNTTLRAHQVAGELIAQGVDPELMYRRIYATVPLRRVELLRHALEHLEVDPEYPVTWITIERGIMEQLGTSSEDLDGIVDHARSIEGTELAILFRETLDGATKISLRSAGVIDVNTIARRFGGGGHVKAAGALIPEGIDEARPRVLAAARTALEEAGLTFRSPSASR